MPVLFDNVNDINDCGKLGGRGGWRLLESRWSSVRELKDDIEEGIVPDKEVLERSMSLRDDWREVLAARVARGLFKFWPLTTRF